MEVMGFISFVLIIRDSPGMMISHPDEALARSHQPAPRGKVVSRTTGMWPTRSANVASASPPDLVEGEALG